MDLLPTGLVATRFPSNDRLYRLASDRPRCKRRADWEEGVGHRVQTNEAQRWEEQTSRRLEAGRIFGRRVRLATLKCFW